LNSVHCHGADVLVALVEVGLHRFDLKDTEDRKQPRRPEQKQEEAEDNFGPMEPATMQMSLPEEGTMLRDRSFSRLFGRARTQGKKETGKL
jgi:hypothetical protein